MGRPVGGVGYEINFSRCTPPGRPEEIEADVRAIDTDIVRMPAEVTGGTDVCK